ncbi:hypothetical protein G6M70_19480 [Agrobacterium tumefaciens]|uniref:Uncharacterized protein n=1 Tax=Agrobacterium tumefaciens TaxID=358 RepID=A0A2L2LJK7_AGRTU|nr:hypothetical protein [Agrobacterium tumefaciens]AVH44523.1 hypothetical protein At1D1609_44810 [Agrobacterium tumefaciens]NSY98431.1 hypothetical protein [Agrobacterium tumefaciens]NSZ04445.1 hypothetical protein [Agrobacterium tumefaciens]NSZ36989.1 hypothetical protein [Agrobacterium tumefaciens]NTB04911.1 hypothetical protein [Agrobacterium tumefaciens]
MTINGKTVFLIGAAILAGLVVIEPKDVHIAIGERAMGGYDGLSNPEAASRAEREAKEAAARAEAAAGALEPQN